MSLIAYFGIGILLMLYTMMHLQDHKQVTSSLGRRWMHWAIILILIAIAWPIWLVASFSTYINEKIANW